MKKIYITLSEPHTPNAEIEIGLDHSLQQLGSLITEALSKLDDFTMDEKKVYKGSDNICESCQ